MNHNLNQIDFQTALAYDRLELNGMSFQPEERWAINTERSLLLQNNRKDQRTSFLSKTVVQKVKKILSTVERLQWQLPDMFSVEP